MQVRLSESPSLDDKPGKGVSTKRVVGYDFTFAQWEKRYNKELAEGKVVKIDNETSINKQSIQSVEHSIYDKELGELADTDKDIREFSCDCGNTYGRFFEGMICPDCGTEVKERFSMDIKRVGWIDIAPFYIINPNAYELLGKCIGLKTLQKILQYDIQIDLDGNLIEHPVTEQIEESDEDNVFALALKALSDNDEETPSEDLASDVAVEKPKKHLKTRKTVTGKTIIPYANSGMIDFRNKFTEIVSYYAGIKGTEEEAKYLIDHQHEIFSSKISVSSIYLRPTFVSSKKRSVSFDALNAIYVKILTNASLLHRVMKKEVDLKRSLNVVFDIQTSLQELYAATIKNKLSGKNKLIRGSILGNRMNYSARMVIRSFVGPHMGMDKCEMSYKGFLELNLLEVINVLMRGYCGMQFSAMTVYEVIEYVRRAQYSEEIDPAVWKACNLLVEKRDCNPIVLLRPPSLALGSLQYLEVCRITPDARDKTLSVPLSSLGELNGDFDGDCLSVFAIKEKRVAEAFREAISPKRLLIDRTGDTYFNTKFGLIKDEITSLISMLS